MASTRDAGAARCGSPGCTCSCPFSSSSFLPPRASSPLHRQFWLRCSRLQTSSCPWLSEPGAYAVAWQVRNQTEITSERQAIPVRTSAMFAGAATAAVAGTGASPSAAAAAAAAPPPPPSTPYQWRIATLRGMAQNVSSFVAPRTFLPFLPFFFFFLSLLPVIASRQRKAHQHDYSVPTTEHALTVRCLLLFL